MGGSNYDAGSDCDDDDDTLNQDDADTDGWSSCDGDCDDDSGAVNPDMEESCDTPQDENCDGRDDEYCTFDYANGSYSVDLCRFEIDRAGDLSDGDCADCEFHFYESDTRMTSGSSCYLGFDTYFGIDLDADEVFLETSRGWSHRYSSALTGRFGVGSWRLYTDYVRVSWSGYAEYPYGYYVNGSFDLYGSW